MALPADVDLVTVRGRYVRLDGTAVSGQVTFTTATVLTDAASRTNIVPGQRAVTLDADGAFAIDLPATDDTDVSPAGWTYAVAEVFPGGRQYAITVPISAKATGVDLATISPASASSGTQAFVLLASFTQLEARVAALEAAGTTGTTTTTTTGIW